MKFNWLIAVLLLLFALSMRAEFEWVFLPIQYDNGAQISAARNFVNGKGFVECAVKVQDVSTVVCEKQTWWAIGAPVMLAAVYRLTGDFLIAEFLLRVFGIAMLLWSVGLIYRFLATEISPIAFYFFCIFYAFLFPQFGLTFTSDVLSLAFFIAACGASFYLVFRQNKIIQTVLLAALIGFLLFVTGFSRYAYYSVIPIVPFSLLLASFVKDASRLRIAAAAVLASVIGFFLLLETVLPGHLTAGSHFKNRPGGFFVENLLLFDQFIFKSFLCWDLFAGFVENFGGVVPFLTNAAIWIFSVVLLFPFLQGCVKSFGRLRFENELKPTDYLKLLTLVALLSSILFLALLSVRIPKMFAEDTWTFVSSTRYFLPFIVLFQINIFNYVSSLKRFKQSSLKLLIACYLIFVFALNVGLWTVFRYKTYVVDASRSTHSYRVRTQTQVNAIIDSIEQTEQKPVVLVAHYGTEPLSENRKYLSGLDFYMYTNQIRAAQPTVLLIRLPKKLKQMETDFLNQHNGRKILELPDSDLYRTDILPE